MVERRQPRVKKRMTCEIVVEGRRQLGIVRDISAGGLFVQTQAHLTPGQVVDVHLPDLGGRGPLQVRARVVRQKRVPPQLVGVAGGGIGLRVLDASPAFRGFAEGARPLLEPAEEAAPEPAREQDAPASPRFHVRVKQSAGPRSRTVTTAAASAQEAEQAVLGELGPGWEVVETGRA